MAVEVGFVDGTIAATTPNGSAISMTFRSVVPADHADGPERPDEAMHLAGREQVLADLVLHDAVAGLVDGQRSQRPGLRLGRVGHGVDDGVDALLREIGQRRLRGGGLPRQLPGFADGSQVTVGGRGGLTHGPGEL